MIENPFVYSLVGKQRLIADDDSKSMRPLAPSELRIATAFSAISPGTELAAYNGFAPLRPTLNVYPRLLGYCNVGRVDESGSDVEGYMPGDYVLTHSAHRSADVVTRQQVLCKVPLGFDLAILSTTYLFILGFSACVKSGLKASDKVGVIGLGTLGLTSAAMASLSGGIVSGFSNHADLNLAACFGVKDINQKSTDLGPHESGFDVVISTTNSWEDWRLALRLARPGGVIVCLGFPGRGEPEPNFNPLASQYFYDKQLTLQGCGYLPDIDANRQDLRFTLKPSCEFILNLIIDGELPADRLIESVRPAVDLDTVYNDMSLNRRSPKTHVLDWGLVDRVGR
jgi:threonine dehydrogenase-like Zn-dependent dehydrogenase